MESFAKLKTDDTIKEEEDSFQEIQDSPSLKLQNFQTKMGSSMNFGNSGLQNYKKSKVDTTPLIPFQLSSSNSDNGFSPDVSLQMIHIPDKKKINFGSSKRKFPFDHPSQMMSPDTGLKTPKIGRYDNPGKVVNLKKIDH